MRARPSVGISGRSGLGLRELRRALRDERVLLAHERAVLALADGDDDLAALAERVGDAALVADGDRRRPARALGDAELVDAAVALVRALLDPAGQLVALPRLGPGRELLRRGRLGGRAEARVGERHRQEEGGGESDDETD